MPGRPLVTMRVDVDCSAMARMILVAKWAYAILELSPLGPAMIEVRRTAETRQRQRPAQLNLVWALVGSPLISCAVAQMPGDEGTAGRIRADLGQEHENLGQASETTSGHENGVSDQADSGSESGAIDDDLLETGSAQEAGSANDPGCQDQLHNLDETDVDCGGPWCGQCGDGKACRDNSDCRSLQCVAGTCASVECQQNSDCQALDDACRIGRCDTDLGICTQRDLPDGQACTPGNFCIVDGGCVAGLCVGQAKDCSSADEACAQGRCDPESGNCFAEPIGDGDACDDLDPCTADDVCMAGICRGRSGVPLFSENFSNPDPGWRMQVSPDTGPSSWEIGRAVAGRGCQIGVDPATDASPDNSGALAGVVIGGCAPAPTGNPDNWDCLVSPKIAISGIGEVELEFARHLGTDLGDAVTDVGVFNRVEVEIAGRWQPLFSGFDHYIVDRAWQTMDFRVIDLAQPELRFRICYANRQAVGSAGFSGWSVDDVVVRNPDCRLRAMKNGIPHP